MNYKLIKLLIVSSISLLLISCNNKPAGETTKKEKVEKKVEKVKKEVKKEKAENHVEKELEKAKKSLSKKEKKIEYKILNAETVVGYYNNKSVTFKELKDKYKKDYDKFAQDNILKKYDTEKLTVEKYANELILIDAAKKKGFKTANELLEFLVKDIKNPSEKEVNDFIKKYSSQLKGMEDSKIKDIATRTIKDKYKTEIIDKFVDNLLKNNKLKVTFPYPSNIPELKIDIEGSPVLGKKDAKYTLVEYSDFQCPYCSRIAPEVKKAIKNNPDVKLVFKHFPLPFHPVAFNAAVASVCANQQNKFFEFHDIVFENQKELTDGKLIEYAKKLKLDIKAFNSCYKSPAATKFVKNDMKIAESIGINGTPSLFLNGVKINAMNEIMITQSIKELRDRVTGDLKDDTVIVSYDDKKITWKMFNNAKPFFKVLNERKRIENEYKFYIDLFNRYVSIKMLDDEAKATGAKSGEEYMKNILSKVTPSSEEELKKTYEQLKPRLAGKTYNEVKSQLVKYDIQMKQQEVGKKELFRLSKKYNVKLDMALPYLPKLHIPTDGAPFIGEKNAPNTLIVFSEFQCPYCSKFATFSKELAEKFPKRLKIVFKHFPLSFHAKAMDASIAAQCAFKQNKFKEYHDLLFKNQSQFSDKNFDNESFIKWAKELKLDENNFKKCLKNKEIKDYINSVIQEGISLEVQGTPTLFLNGQPLQLKSHTVELFEKFLK